MSRDWTVGRIDARILVCTQEVSCVHIGDLLRAQEMSFERECTSEISREISCDPLPARKRSLVGVVSMGRSPVKLIKAQPTPKM